MSSTKRLPWSVRVFLLLLALPGTLAILQGCIPSIPLPWQTQYVKGEILIGLKTEAIPLLRDQDPFDPTNTGILSLDALNTKYGVQAMIPVFPGLEEDETAVKAGLSRVFKLVVSKDIDVQSMAREYANDPHIEYAEPVHIVTVQ